jgi:hypothetical protein
MFLKRLALLLMLLVPWTAYGAPTSTPTPTPAPTPIVPGYPLPATPTPYQPLTLACYDPLISCPATTSTIEGVAGDPSTAQTITLGPQGSRPFGDAFICPCSTDSSGAYVVPYNVGDSAIFAFVQRPANLPSTLDMTINNTVETISTTAPYIQPADTQGVWTIGIDTVSGGVHYVSNTITVKSE